MNIPKKSILRGAISVNKSISEHNNAVPENNKEILTPDLVKSIEMQSKGIELTEAPPINVISNSLALSFHRDFLYQDTTTTRIPVKQLELINSIAGTEQGLTAYKILGNIIQDYIDNNKEKIKLKLNSSINNLINDI